MPKNIRHQLIRRKNQAKDHLCKAGVIFMQLKEIYEDTNNPKIASYFDMLNKSTLQVYEFVENLEQAHLL